MAAVTSSSAEPLLAWLQQVGIADDKKEFISCRVALDAEWSNMRRNLYLYLRCRATVQPADAASLWHYCNR